MLTEDPALLSYIAEETGTAPRDRAYFQDSRMDRSCRVGGPWQLRTACLRCGRRRTGRRKKRSPGNTDWPLTFPTGTIGWSPITHRSQQLSVRNDVLSPENWVSTRRTGSPISGAVTLRATAFKSLGQDLTNRQTCARQWQDMVASAARTPGSILPPACIDAVMRLFFRASNTRFESSWIRTAAMMIACSAVIRSVLPALRPIRRLPASVLHALRGWRARLRSPALAHGNDQNRAGRDRGRPARIRLLR